jgi:integrase
MSTNRPQKGSQIKVGPIKKLKDVDTIKKLLANHPRNYALFIIGINTNLRASDLRRITVGMVKHLAPGESFELTERKTAKKRCINLNKACVSAIYDLLRVRRLNDADPLFMSKKGCMLTVQSIHRLVKGWCRQIHLKGNYGSHTLRKTWGYHQRVTFGVDLPTLMVIFNHGSQRQTLDYLCVPPQEIKDVYENEL